ncbi:MAG: AI-2E family transporter, partial [Anaerovoracaceae bacterium]
MKQLKEVLKDRILMRYSLFIAFTAALLYILYFIIKNLDDIALLGGKGLSSVLGALAPLFVGMVIAYLVNPLVETMDKRLMPKLIRTHADPLKNTKREKKKRLLSVFLSYLLIMAFVVAIIYGFVALIMGQFVFASLPKMMDSVVNYFLSYEETVKSWVANIPAGVLSDKVQAIADSFLTWITNNFSTKSVVNTVTGIGGNIVNFVIGIIVSIYLVYDKDFFIGLWHKLIYLLFPQRVGTTINNSLTEVNSVVSQFVRGVLLDALIVAVLSSIGLSILGLKFAVFIGIFAGVCNVIPYFGPVLGMIPAFLIGLLTEGFWHGAFAILVLLIVQQIDCNIIYPKVVGSSTGLHPLFVLLAVSLGGVYGGLVGMVIAVPIIGVLQIFVI